MKYLKFTYVDAVTGVSIDVTPATNGQVYPAVEELVFDWGNVSAYPTAIPYMYGTCPDYSNTAIAGVLDTYTKADYDALHAAELHGRVISLSFRDMVLKKTQSRLDAFAKEHGFDSIQSASTYVNSTVTRFVNDAVCAIAMRDDTWSTLYRLMDEVDAGTRSMPTTYEEVLVLLPVLVWPSP